MKFGKILMIGGLLAGFATPMFATTIYGEFDASGQGTISTTGSGASTVATGLTFGGTVGTTGGGNLRPTGTVTQDGLGVFGKFSESESFFYHFIASVPAGSPAGTKPTAPFLFSSVTPAGVEFLQANTDPLLGFVKTMKFYITTVQDVTINTGAGIGGTTGGFDGFGYVTFSGVFDPTAAPGTLFKEAVEYSVDLNKGAGQRPLTVEIFATAPSPIPEPSSLALLGTGMLSVAGLALRKLRPGKAA